MLLVDVALPVPLARSFTYELPARLAPRAVAGARVVCPFGSRRMLGVVLAQREGEPPDRVRAIAEVADEGEPAITPELLELMKSLASYYFAPIGEVMRLALPPVEKATSRELAEPSLFEGDAKGVGVRRVKWVRPTDTAAPDGGLRGQAAAILAHVRAVGEAPITKLERQWGNARAVIKRLTDLGLVTIDAREAPDDPFFAEPAPREPPPTLTAAQTDAIVAIDAALGAREGKTFLLHGVTGSGKTEVYLRAIASARALGRGAIVLVPEIALTPQLVARFRGRFGDDVAVIHSALTPKERLTMWRRLRRGELDVVIGARSAIFAPVSNVGLIVVDEEHDPSFKQEEGVRYHARDMAILRASRAGGVCVLGSATPSLESEHLTRVGKATKLRLRDRPRERPLPKVELVDLRRIGPGPTGDKRMSITLYRALEKTLAAKEQAILFLNRRGFAPSVRCEACGVAAACPRCTVALTFHKRAGALVRCHYCDYERPMPAACEACGAPALVLEGLGTEKLEESLSTAFPTARVARLDRDVASGHAIEKILARVRAREVDILVGTQMVTKGHDLPNVTLVGVINADAALSIPDFRAAERAFQLIVQVAGRAGRGDVPGSVLVQTCTPDHAALSFAARHDVDGFLEREIADRRELGYPPFSRIALVRVDAVDEDVARAACGELARVALGAAKSSVDVLGPAAAPLARLRNRFRFRIMIRSRERGDLRAVLGAVDRARAMLPHAVRSSIDVDPVQLL